MTGVLLFGCCHGVLGGGMQQGEARDGSGGATK
jgi:hypothetical protein